MAQAHEGKLSGRAAEVFELKSASLSLLALVLRSTDLQALRAALQAKLGDTPDVFNQDALLIDLTQLPQASVSTLANDVSAPTQLSLDDAVASPPLDLPALLSLLREYRMQPVAVTGAGADLLTQAQALGLADAQDLAPAPRSEARVETVEVVREVVKEVLVEQVREVPVAAEAARTVIVDKPLRSGQQVYARGADLVVMALVNHGAEVIADGNIHVYAPLRGKAIAGARGNTEARIFATSLEAELIAIAGIYRTTENPLPAEVLGKPAQVRLEGEKLVMEALKL
jgi:septum site-determining protein MinC